MIETRITELYEEFKALPAISPIVRVNQKNDAFTILVAELVLRDYLEEDFKFAKDNINKISSFVVAPPDDGIDIFFEQEEADESYFHIIQVKNSKLDESQIDTCFAKMKNTIYGYLREPRTASYNLRKLISNTNFNRNYLDNCYYYVVHIGEVAQIRRQEENDSIITLSHLQILMNSFKSKSLKNICVPSEKIRIDENGNFIMYSIVDGITSYLCNMNGYDLAQIGNKYINTSIGRNILFGQNLRDSLSKKSKTYKQMIETISNEPEHFWYFNNGISIIASKANIDESNFLDPVTNEVSSHDGACLENFSIINGAQTVSTLASYLREAEIDRDFQKIKKLNNVHVLARLVEVPLKNTVLRNNIAIYNNSQNPITTRDMVSNNEEQRTLHENLLNGSPCIFLEIRRGTTPPASKSFLAHRKKITNEELAQLAFAAFLKSPFKAKDKKKTLFNNTFSKEWTINEDYHKIFNLIGENKGILFEKSNEEIDELLFIKHVHNDARKYFKNVFKERIEQLKVKLENSVDAGKPFLESQIKQMIRNTEIVSVCLFYNLALYYEFKDNYDVTPNTKFDMDKYYEDNNYKKNLIDRFEKVFIEKTIQIIRDNSGNMNVNNWIRNPKNEEIFFSKLRDDIALKIDYGIEYKDFIDEFKIMK